MGGYNNMTECGRILQELEMLKNTNDERLARRLSDWYGFVLSELTAGRVGDFIRSVPVDFVSLPFNGKRVENLINKCIKTLFEMAEDGRIPFETTAYMAESLRTGRKVRLRHAGQICSKKLGHALPVVLHKETITEMILREAKLLALSKVAVAVKLYCRIPGKFYPAVCCLSSDCDIAKKALRDITKDFVRDRMASFPKVNLTKDFFYLESGYSFDDGGLIFVNNGRAYYRTKDGTHELPDADLDNREALYMQIARAVSKVIEYEVAMEFEKEKHVRDDDDWVFEIR